MGKAVETLSTINSFIRTVLAVVVAGAIGAGGWFGYRTVNENEITLKEKDRAIAKAQQELEAKDAQLVEKDGEIAQRDEMILVKDGEINELNIEVEEKQQQIEKLDTAIRLMTVDHRLARITVVDQEADDAGQLFTTIRFVEVDDKGEALGPARTFRLEGDVVYIDCLVVKFEDQYIQDADNLRGMSLCMFRRIFGERQKPMDGFVLDQEGARPGVYERGGKMSDLEKKIWDDFWNIANDLAKAEELGIRAIHGTAVSEKVAPGIEYRLLIRADGDISIKPTEKPASETDRPPA